ncbi:MAG: hypothetical protein OXK77_05005 [Gemmatimonadota bacterium]|nr:hypothetical protein [Gemmatimonadota bacterium]MDE2865937.1 hypothetical protein [Gemmatimonadota bacterium]
MNKPAALRRFTSLLLPLAVLACHESQDSVVEPVADAQHDRIEVLRALMGSPLDETTSARITRVWGPVVITKLQPGQSWSEAPFPPQPDRIEALRALIGTSVDEVPSTLSTALGLAVEDGEQLNDVLYRVLNTPVVITRLEPGQDWREVPLPSRADRLIDEGGFCGDPLPLSQQEEDDDHPDPECEIESGATEEEWEAFEECSEAAEEGDGNCTTELVTQAVRDTRTGRVRYIITGAHVHCDD